MFIAIDVQVYDSLKSAEFSKSGIRMAGVMQEAPSHVYFYKKHRHIGPKLSVVLQQMKQEGLIEKYKGMALTNDK